MTQHSRSCSFLLLTENEAPQDALLSTESIEVRPLVPKGVLSVRQTEILRFFVFQKVNSSFHDKYDTYQTCNPTNNRGVRIVCAFIDDIYMISDLITQQDDIKVIEIKDYIKNPKSNGYRSYHMIVEIPVFFAKGKTPMRVELQIRTNGMDFWATLEHQLRYKKGIEEMPGYDEISEELLHSARAIIEADNEMQRIKDKIGMFHEI